MLSEVVPRTGSSIQTSANTYFGPWSRGLGQIYIVTTIVLSFGAYDFQPPIHTLALGFAFGCLLLAPRRAVLDIRVSLVSIMMLSIITLSILWTFDSVTTPFLIRLEVPRLVFLLLVVAVMPFEDTIGGLRKAMWVVLLITVAALIIFPEARFNGIVAGSNQPYPGWRGFFIHKNALSPYLIFALATLLVWERGRYARPLGFVVIMTLMIGSQSGTGIAGSLFVISFYIWVRLYRRSENRWSGGFVVASSALAVCLAAVGYIAVLAIAQASGKGTSLSGRTFIWSAVLDAISERPLLGYGYGGLFQRPPSDVTREIWRNIGFEANHSHNGTLDLLVQLGVVGTAIFGALFVSTLVGGMTADSPDRRLSDWILIVLSVQVLVSLSEPVFLGPWLVVIMILRGLTLKSMPSWRDRHGRVTTAHVQRDDEAQSVAIDQ